MTAPVLGDALGPRGRRRVLIATIASGVALSAMVFVAYRRLDDSGQLTAEKWRPFTQWPIIKFLLLGLLTTLKVAAVSMGLAIVLGSMLALGRLARNGPARWITGAWVEIFRAIPLLLLIYFAARGLPRLLNAGGGGGFDLPLFWYLVFGLVLYNSAVLAEIFRAGILSLDRGQSEAAYAVGMSYWQTMLLVVVPQAIRRMVPAVVSQLVTLLKDTSLGFILPYEEFLRRGQLVGEVPGKPLLQSFAVIALVYILVNFALSRLARRLEVRQRRRYGAGRIDVGGAEDLTAVSVAGDTRA